MDIAGELVAAPATRRINPVFSHFRGFLKPLKACADPLDEFTDAGEVLDPLAGARKTHIKVSGDVFAVSTT